MATFSYQTTDDEEQAVLWFTRQENTRTAQDKTAMDYARDALRHWLQSLVVRHAVVREADKATLYQRASAQDKARIDAILDTYRE